MMVGEEKEGGVGRSGRLVAARCLVVGSRLKLPWTDSTGRSACSSSMTGTGGIAPACSDKLDITVGHWPAARGKREGTWSARPSRRVEGLSRVNAGARTGNAVRDGRHLLGHGEGEGRRRRKGRRGEASVCCSFHTLRSICSTVLRSCQIAPISSGRSQP